MSTGTPPGWWTYGPKMWAGCSWTGIDVVAGTTTTNTPKDFVTKAPADPYCVSGSVNANNDSVALLGFNLAQPVAGANCAYNPTLIQVLPGVTLTGTGIAVAFSKKISTDMRIQVQGPMGATLATDRWCAKITDPAGPVFVPYTSFNTKCWDNSGTTFNPAANMIAAVSFLVAGGTAPTPFNYCIGGFSTGTSAADAPAYAGTTGPVTGTIGGPGGMPIDYQRVKVSAGGKSYIVQNNNWGNWQGTDQTLQYTDNSFKITSPTGASPDGMKPASFPSVYIGANGDTQMGTYSTHLNNGMANQAGDNLPKQISSIQSIKSTFRYNTAGGDYNATYDIWFASGAPTSAYDDGISGFVMIWLYKPGSRSPIGSVMRSNVTIPGAPGTWNVWVGPRGTGTNPNRPVVSYVATSTLMALTNVDIKAFITDAAANGISNTWYLTDVFAGFEIWGGGGTANLSVQEFTAVVQ